MDTTESSVNFEHSIFKIKNILFNLFPGANIHFNADWLDKKFLINQELRVLSIVTTEYSIQVKKAFIKVVRNINITK
jgi:hypothetical protein